MVKIEEITNQNLWWKHGNNWVSYDDDIRTFNKQLVKFKRRDIKLEIGKTYIIRGQRRTGKTVYLKENIRKITEKGKEQGQIDPRQVLYYNCESLLSHTRAQLDKVIKQFFDLSSAYDQKYLFLDEITHIPEWNTELKNLRDTGYLRDVVTVITGSLPSELKERAEQLPGRAVEENEYLLKPITFRDFLLSAYSLHPRYNVDNEIAQSLQTLVKKLSETDVTLESDSETVKNAANKIYPYLKEINTLFEIYLLTGGFPEVINSYIKNQKKSIESKMYEEIVRYVEGDTAKTGKRAALTTQILQNILRKIGTRYSYNTLAKDLETGVQHQTLISYLDVLESSFILHLLYAYDFTRKTLRERADKKIYFADPFIYHALKSQSAGLPGFDYSKEYLLNEEISSSLVENVVVTHMVRTKEAPIMKEPRSFLWFYYDRNKEIDIIYRKDSGEYLGMEVKYKSEVSVKDLKKVDPIKNYILLTKNDFDLTKTTQLVIPTSLFLSLLKVSDRNL